jgi:phosphatidate phosphatase
MVHHSVCHCCSCRGSLDRTKHYAVPDLIALMIELVLFTVMSLLIWLEPEYVPPGDFLSSYPTHDSTVSSTMLFVYTVGSFVIVLFGLQLVARYFPDWITPFNPWAAAWLWCGQLLLTLTFSQFFKYYVGRPRPDLYVQCGPDAQYDTCRSLTGMTLDNQFMSWPSGHASSSFGGFLFVALFLKVAIPTDYALVSTLAVLVTTVAFWIGATRISDYKHHSDDVTAGFFMAAFVDAMLWYRGYKRIFPKAKEPAAPNRIEDALVPSNQIT